MILKKINYYLSIYFSTVFLCTIFTFNAMEQNKQLIPSKNEQKNSLLSLIKKPHWVDWEYTDHYFNLAIVMHRNFNIPKKLITAILLVTREKNEAIETKKIASCRPAFKPSQIKIPLESNEMSMSFDPLEYVCGLNIEVHFLKDYKK